MSTARCVTYYCITMDEDHQFENWGLQGSHDAISWITLHVGSEAFVGRSCFYVNNTNYYEYYRIKVYNWLGIAGIPELDFYERIEDHTTTSSSYTTTTSTSISTTTLTTSTLISTTVLTTVATTTAPPVYVPPNYVSLTGNAGNYTVTWQSSSHASTYEVQIRYNSQTYVPLLFTVDNFYLGQDVPMIANTVQFRVRYHFRGTAVSAWTESNILTLPKVIVNFQASCRGAGTSSFLSIAQTGQQVQFTDLSVSDHGSIVKWLWTFYTNVSGTSIHNVTSSLQNPHYTYLSAGLFAVSLTVTDSTGRSSTTMKTGLIEVGCQLIADFLALDINGVECTDYTEISYGETVRFIDRSGPGDVINRQWQFFETEDGSGLYQTSTLKQLSRTYSEPSRNYAVGMKVTGAYGQTGFILKPSFVRTSKDMLTTTISTTWLPFTETTVSITTTTEITATTSPPDNWLRIPMRGGTPLCDGYVIGYEPYRAFDGDPNTKWEAQYPTTLPPTTSSTTYTTMATTTVTTTTVDYFLSHQDIIDFLWTPNSDIDDFRRRFIEFMTVNNVYGLRKFDVLPPFKDVYSGMMVYEILNKKFYVGLESSWAQVNPEYALHVLSHVSSVDPVISYGFQPPENAFKGIIWVIPDTTTTTAATTAATTTPPMWLGNEAIIGAGFYPQCNSFTPGHECTNPFDGSTITYWESLNAVTESAPEWLGMYWAEPKIIKLYRFYCGSVGSPVTWSLLASKNGLTWIMIDYKYLDNTVGWNWFGVDNDTDYNFYRFQFFKTRDGENSRVYSLEMYNVATPA